MSKKPDRYKAEKRSKELANKKKKEQKIENKLNKKQHGNEEQEQLDE